MHCEYVQYTQSDQPGIEAFFEVVFNDLGRVFDLNRKDADIGRIIDVYLSEGGTFLLAKHSAEIVGTIAMRRLSNSTAELKRFYVLRKHRGSGIGHELLKQLLENAKHVGFEKVRLDTTSESPAAISLFRRNGFMEIPRYHDDPHAELFFEKTISKTE